MNCILLKILKHEIFPDGTKITTYDGGDISTPHCGEYCVTDSEYPWECIHCGDSRNEDPSKRKYHEVEHEMEHEKEKVLDDWM